MENSTYYFLAVLCIMTHIIRLVYEILKHKKILIPNKLTFTIIFLNMALLWISWFSLCGMDPYRIDLPGIVRYSGLILCITGLIVFLTALFTIKTLETYSGALITKGIYSKIRHPMYLGFIFWLIGFPVFSGAGYSLILAFLLIANVLFWRHLEEIELVKRFSDYNNYKSNTLF